MHWNPDPALLRLGGLTIYWYGFLFTVGLFVTVLMAHRYFVQRGLEEKHASNLTFWNIAGLFLGAHVLDVIAYNWSAFIADPSILFQINRGLSSHGGGLGVLAAVLLYTRLYRQDFWRISDGIMLAAMWLFPFVRLGNFFNSEIIGVPTSLPWGVVFEATGLPEPRHPSQLYHVLEGIGLVLAGSWLHHRMRHRLRKGATFLIVLGLYFTSRFFVEFTKEQQALPADFPLTMGHLLSLPAAAACWGVLWMRRPVLVVPGDPEAGDPRPPGSTSLVDQVEPPTEDDAS